MSPGKARPSAPPAGCACAGELRTRLYRLLGVFSSAFSRAAAASRSVCSPLVRVCVCRRPRPPQTFLRHILFFCFWADQILTPQNNFTITRKRAPIINEAAPPVSFQVGSVTSVLLCTLPCRLALLSSGELEGALSRRRFQEARHRTPVPPFIYCFPRRAQNTLAALTPSLRQCDDT